MIKYKFKPESVVGSRTLVGTKFDMACNQCLQELENPSMREVLYCPETRKIWHKACFLKMRITGAETREYVVPFNHGKFMGYDHEEIAIDNIEVMEEENNG